MAAVTSAASSRPTRSSDLKELKSALLKTAEGQDRRPAADRDRQSGGGTRRGRPQVHRQVLHLLPRPAELLLRSHRRRAEQVRVLPSAPGAVLPAGLVGQRRPRHRPAVHRAEQAGREQPRCRRRVPAGRRDLPAGGHRGRSRPGASGLRERQLRAVSAGRPQPPPTDRRCSSTPAGRATSTPSSTASTCPAATSSSTSPTSPVPRGASPVELITDDVHASALDIWSVDHPGSFFVADPQRASPSTPT